MQVRFTKMPGRRYSMKVTREHGPDLAETQAPGYDDDIPHEVAHFIAEAEAGLTGGVFGRVASGRNQIFRPLDATVLRKQSRREKRPLPKQAGADMRRSEFYASTCTVLWELRSGRRTEPPIWLDGVESQASSDPVIERIIDRLDHFAKEWCALPAGGSITLEWPHRPVALTARRVNR